MIDTQKLLYILPDVAYVAELLPDKRPHHFTIHSFTQINGTFFDENENFIADKIDKLLSKLEKGETYHIVLPDFLFTNTIVSVKETSETKIKEYLKTETLPSINISSQTHELVTVILNQLRGITRVQLAALEKEMLIPLKLAAAAYDLVIAGISPLSWVSKSSVSLEPSITVLQMGGHLYVAEHYIGVDQNSYALADDCASIAETIKTLKGTEPSIQTVYVFSNALVEEKLKELLNKTVPLQQMAASTDGDERMPSYVQGVIEASMRTLSIPDYPVPVFPLDKPTAAEKKAAASLVTAGSTALSDDEDEVSDLPKPQPAPVQEKPAVKMDAVSAEKSTDTSAKTQEEPSEPTTIQTEEKNDPVDTLEESDTEKESTDLEEIEEAEEDELDLPQEKERPAFPDKMVAQEVKPASRVAETAVETAVSVGEERIDLRQFVQAQSDSKEVPRIENSVPTKTPIRHNSGVWPMMKMILIAVGVFLVTVGIGVGIGFAFLKFSAPDQNTPAPVVEVVTSPTPQPTTTPTPTPSTATASATPSKQKQLKMLVVNATKKSGYAGTIKAKIETTKLGTVATGNAKGTYTEGILIYQKNADSAVLSQLEKALGLTLTETEKVGSTEDAQGTYDIVIVLAE